MRSTIFHTKIETKPLCKNGSEKYGVNAICKMWMKEGGTKMEITQFGKTTLEATQKLNKFLTSDGVDDLQESVG